MNAVPSPPIPSLSVAETLELLSGGGEVVLCGHPNPDGDTLGSALALAEFLRLRGFSVTNLLASSAPPPEVYAFLENYVFLHTAVYDKDPDLFIAVDLPNTDRLGSAAAIAERAGYRLCIDHHPDYSGFADAYYGSTQAAATGVLVWELIKASGVPITKSMAECCYIALVTDTGRFSFQNTDTRALIAAAEMLAAGADPAEINVKVYEQKSVASLELDARLISRIRFADEGRVIYSWVDESDFTELGLSRDESEGLPNILRSVKGVEVAILLRQEGSRTRVNMRAKGSFDVGEVARRFGGGGHKAAAGFTLAKPLPVTLDLLLAGKSGLSCCDSADVATPVQ